MKAIITFITFFFILTTHQYRAYGQASLSNQTYQQDTAAIRSLLKSAKSKRFSDSATAIREVYQALALAQKHNDGYWSYESYHRLGRIHEVNQQNKKAHLFFVKELEFENALDDSTKSFMYSEVAHSYRNIGDFRKCYELLVKNEALVSRSNNIYLLQNSFLNFGVFCANLNDFEKATQNFTKSLELAIQMNDPDEVCDSYRSLAGVYVKSKNYDLALKCAEQSISYVNKINNNNFPIYFAYSSYGKILKDCKKYKEAIKALEKAAQLCIAVDDKSSLSDFYNSLADIYTELNDLNQAEYYYKKCSSLISETSELDVMVFAHNNSKFLIKKGEYDKAVIMLNKSVSLALQYDRKFLLQKNYERLSEVFEQKNDHKKSLFYVRKALLLRDAIFSEENTKRVAEAQFKYNLAQSEEDVKKIKTRHFYTILISLAIILFLFIAFLVYFLRSKDQKNKLLLEKTQMLTETTLIIKDKNRQLEESNEILRQFAFASAHDLKEPLRSINSFVNIIQRKYLKILPPEATEYMGFVTVGVKRMESLLNALLEFSSVLIDDDSAHKNNDVKVVLKDVFHHYESLINEKNAVIKGPSVFPTIEMNEAHLKQVLSNLVHNALKFSKIEAKIEIGYETTTEELILYVKDAGIGLDKSYSDKIFKLFQRLDRVTHKESVGVGLTICKNIMDKYAGRIWFESVIEEGTTFYIAFPKSMISDVPTEKEAPQYLAHFSADLSAAVL
jgi:signal transduction histidine kinase